MVAGILFFVLLLALFGWLFPPRGGWVQYLRDCPLWRDPG
jgi:hypothetical protein